MILSSGLRDKGSGCRLFPQCHMAYPQERAAARETNPQSSPFFRVTGRAARPLANVLKLSSQNSFLTPKAKQAEVQTGSIQNVKASEKSLF